MVDDWERLERYEEKLISHFEVHCAPFADHGLEMAKADPPDYFLIDLVLGDMTASEAMTAIHAMGLTGPAVVIIDSQDAFADSQCRFLERPVPVDFVASYFIRGLHPANP